MSIWNHFHFRKNPYQTQPIEATQEGQALLVGREVELKRLKTRIISSSTHPTIEGENGVGKTSLVSVAAYELLCEFRANMSNGLWIPVSRSFQLSSDTNVEEFVRRVYIQVAGDFLKYYGDIAQVCSSMPSVDSIEKWLNAPTFKSISGGASAFGFGASGRSSEAPNTSSGFALSGFNNTIEDWLEVVFKDREGGFICVLDNLELLEQSRDARRQIEALRDALFNQVGLKWVLCGARGIITSTASSQRLQGVLAEPVLLRPIESERVPLVVKRRIEVFGNDGALPPVGPEGFQHIYAICNSNLRTSLKFCDDFAIWLHEQDKYPDSEQERNELLQIWFAEQADRQELATRGVNPRSWQVFDGIVNCGGSSSPSDFSQFGFKSSQAMRSSIKTLEEANLVVSSIDESDQRRRTIEVTARGWLVNYRRSGYTFTSENE